MSNTRIACIGASIAAIMAIMMGLRDPTLAIAIVAALGACFAVALFGK